MSPGEFGPADRAEAAGHLPQRSRALLAGPQLTIVTRRLAVSGHRLPAAPVGIIGDPCSLSYWVNGKPCRAYTVLKGGRPFLLDVALHERS